ncbi:MAG: hypothetical protein JWO96_495 [Candidatus Saccharibacteria bacterium]|nr:hypothetical protein [Candidatus Saccharibacteria bacterium]
MTAKIKSHAHHTKTSHKHKPKGLSDKKFASVYWPYIPIILLAGFLLVFTSHNGVLATMLRHPTSKVLGYATSMDRQNLLLQTNSARQANNIKPLFINDLLSRAAQAKADDMAAHNYWSHQTPAGNPPWAFASAQGYNYQKLGENLATGFADPQATINGWMASTEHRNNMLDTAYTQVGFGYANNPNYTSAGGGPMTIIVAFYGEPVGISDASNNRLVGAGAGTSGNSNTSSGLPSGAAATTRAQLAFARTPISGQATTVTLCALMVVVGIWIGRHLFMLRRVIVQGESFIISHPLMDVGLILLGLAFFALSRTAGLIQ